MNQIPKPCKSHSIPTPLSQHPHKAWFSHCQQNSTRGTTGGGEAAGGGGGKGWSREELRRFQASQTMLFPAPSAGHLKFHLIFD